MLLEFNNVSFSYEGQEIISNLSFGLTQHQKVGLIGPNGSGKSTILRLAAKLLEPNSGGIKTDERIAYLPQLPDFDLNQSVLEFLDKEEDWVGIDQLYTKLWNESLDLTQSLADLSGGQLTKLNLARMLNRGPEVLLLDEPTNHLDRISLDRLAQIITAKSAPSWIMASHDVSFLDRTVKTIWSLAGSQIQVFGGNYSFFKQQKKIIAEANAKHLEAANKNLNRVKIVYDEFKRKTNIIVAGQKRAMQTGIAASESGFFRESAQNKAGTKKLMLDQRLDLANIEVVKHKSEFRRPIHFLVSSKPGRGKVIELEQGRLSLTGGRTLLQEMNLSLNSGQRLSLTGANGSGKSVLVRSLIHEIDKQKNPDAQSPTKTDFDLSYSKFYATPELAIAYLDQHYALVNTSLSLLENLDLAAAAIDTSRKILQLAYFGFNIQQVYQPASTLSGGQIAKLALAMLTLTPIDLLILDEITNNLDIETQEVIARTLANYTGSMIVISHNQSFLDSLKLSGEWAIIDNTIRIK